MKFAVFGLGNKTYEHFNAMGKLATRSWRSLEGSEFIFLELETTMPTWKTTSLPGRRRSGARFVQSSTSRLRVKSLTQGSMSTRHLGRGTSRRTRCTQGRWLGSDRMSLRGHLLMSRTHSWLPSPRTGTCTTREAEEPVFTSSWTLPGVGSGTMPETTWLSTQ